VFCGSRPGNAPAYVDTARRLGRVLAQRGQRLVFGGGRVGLMGAVADGALSAGGQVIGVIPRALAEREVAHTELSELRVVGSMHERKALMSELSDGFIALPGGLGTLEELFEVWTWAQLGIHRKPCGLLEADGLFSPLLSFLDSLVERGFVMAAHRDMLLVDADPCVLLDRMAGHRPAAVDKLLGRDET
jgi:hypothetical protein